MSQRVIAGPEQEPVSCPGCAYPDSVTVLSTGQGQTLLRCRRCGLVFTRPTAQPSELTALYPEGYYAHQAAAWAPGRFQIVRSLALQRYYGYPLPADLAGCALLRLMQPAARLLAPLKGYWRTIPPAVFGGRLLDVGCGSGAYLARVRALGWQVSGIEPDVDACARARDLLALNVFCGTLEDKPLPEERYDVVTFWHSLEHSAQALRTLQRAHSLLRQGGLIMLEVPNRDSVQRHIFGYGWFHLDLPRHRVHFGASALRQCLATAGFTDVRVASVPSPVGITGSLEGTLQRHRPEVGARAWRHNRALKAAFWPPEALLSCAGLGGCLMATARKP